MVRVTVRARVRGTCSQHFGVNVVWKYDGPIGRVGSQCFRMSRKRYNTYCIAMIGSGEISELPIIFD